MLREGFVVTDVLPVLVHDLGGSEGAQRVVVGTLVTFLAVPRRLVVLAVHSAVARAGTLVRQQDLHLVIGQLSRVPLRQLAHQSQPALLLVLGRNLGVHVLNLGVFDEADDASAPPLAVVSATPATVAATAATPTVRASVATVVMVVVVLVLAYRYAPSKGEATNSRGSNQPTARGGVHQRVPDQETRPRPSQQSTHPHRRF